MKTNRMSVVLIIISVLVLASMAFTASPSALGQEAPPALTLPIWAQMLITAAASYLITAGIKSLLTVFPNLPDLSGLSTALTGAVVLFVVSVSNALLALIPPELQPAVTAFFGFAAAILSMYGIAGTAKAFQPTKR